MKKTITTIAVILFSLGMQAQGLYIAPYINFSKANLYNKEDSRAYDNNGYSTLLPAVQYNFVPAYGVDLGFNRTLNGFGLKEVYTGVGYLPLAQKYKGHFVAWGDDSKAEGTTTLNYLRVPLHLTFGLNEGGAVTPFFSFGINMNYLLSYSENAYSSYLSNNGNQPVDVVWEIEDGKWLREYSNPAYFKEEYTFDSWHYTRTVWNTYAAVGLAIKINKQMETTIKLFNSMSLNNPESNNEKKYVSTLDGREYQFNPYDKFVSKIYLRQNLDPRPESQLRQTGLQLGISYRFLSFNSDNSNFY